MKDAIVQMPLQLLENTGAIVPPQLDVTILVPVHNEEQVLEESVCELVQGCDAHGILYEIILCENGSKDNTLEIAVRLSETFPSVRVLHYTRPDYGGALNAGIQEARGRNIVCFEIDFYDVSFVEIANVLLKKYDAVIGSKRAPGARDYRPRVRRFITWGFNSFLRIFFGFKGTDTHGIKAFRAEVAKPIAAECKTDRDVFTTELVIRMERADLRMCEMPLEIVERRPAPINIVKRVPSALHNIWRLRKAMRGVRQTRRTSAPAFHFESETGK
jgi:glycosyltransferase involved in cell wall biosynthesis